MLLAVFCKTNKHPGNVKLMQGTFYFGEVKQEAVCVVAPGVGNNGRCVTCLKLVVSLLLFCVLESRGLKSWINLGRTMTMCFGPSASDVVTGSRGSYLGPDGKPHQTERVLVDFDSRLNFHLTGWFASKKKKSNWLVAIRLILCSQKYYI